MPFGERESALARRLRELEEEERRIRQSIKEVDRQLRKLERARGGDGRLAPISSVVAKPAIREAAPLAEPNAPAAGPEPSGNSAEVPLRSLSPAQNDRFARYFASGSFVRARPLERERRMMRNKSIFLLIVALLLGFLVYRLVL